VLCLSLPSFISFDVSLSFSSLFVLCCICFSFFMGYVNHNLGATVVCTRESQKVKGLFKKNIPVPVVLIPSDKGFLVASLTSFAPL
jgi:ABC-type molybdate transport system permease subunit